MDERASDLAAMPRFNEAVRSLTAGFTSVQQQEPRLSSLFATQQRWLMSHVALACHFRGAGDGRPGFSRCQFLEAIRPLTLASRNTAAAFFNEALQYGVIRPSARARHVEPAPETLLRFEEWLAMHLAALDLIDAQNRLARLRKEGSALLALAQPFIAHELTHHPIIRTPPPAYAIFGSVDEGGSLMDRLISGLDPNEPADVERAITNVTSISDLVRSLNLSRTHAGRTFAAAAAIGAVGWTGAPGHTRIWLSRDFRRAYAQIQALKLAIIETSVLSLSTNKDLVATSALRRSSAPTPHEIRRRS